MTLPDGTLVCPWKRAAGYALTEGEQQFNSRMSRRIAVEWGFLKVIQKFAYLDNYKQLQIWGTPVHQYYTVAGILTNIHSCLYSNQTAKYFNCQPPTPKLLPILLCIPDLCLFFNKINFEKIFCRIRTYGVSSKVPKKRTASSAFAKCDGIRSVSNQLQTDYGGTHVE